MAPRGLSLAERERVRCDHAQPGQRSAVAVLYGIRGIRGTVVGFADGEDGFAAVRVYRHDAGGGRRGGRAEQAESRHPFVCADGVLNALLHHTARQLLLVGHRHIQRYVCRGRGPEQCVEATFHFSVRQVLRIPARRIDQFGRDDCHALAPLLFDTCEGAFGNQVVDERCLCRESGRHIGGE